MNIDRLVDAIVKSNLGKNSAVCDSCGAIIPDYLLDQCANTDDAVLLCPKCHKEAEGR